MKTVTATGMPNLTELSTEEKREIFLKRQGWSITALAERLGIHKAVLARSLKSPTMPVRHHEKLVQLGMPPELLPEPLDKKTGPAPKSISL